jgi:hypothetical protein
MQLVYLQMSSSNLQSYLLWHHLSPTCVIAFVPFQLYASNSWHIPPLMSGLYLVAFHHFSGAVGVSAQRQFSKYFASVSFVLPYLLSSLFVLLLNCVPPSSGGVSTPVSDSNSSILGLGHRVGVASALIRLILMLDRTLQRDMISSICLVMAPKMQSPIHFKAYAVPLSSCPDFTSGS